MALGESQPRIAFTAVYTKRLCRAIIQDVTGFAKHFIHNINYGVSPCQPQSNYESLALFDKRPMAAEITYYHDKAELHFDDVNNYALTTATQLQLQPQEWKAVYTGIGIRGHTKVQGSIRT